MGDDLIPASNLTRRRPLRSSPRKRGQPRRKTVAMKRLTREVIAAGWDEAGGKPDPLESLPRPRRRSQCPTIRPCPFVSCRHHLYLDVNPETGSITLNFPDREPDELEDSCSLDVAAGGPLTLEVVGDILNITRERVRQLESLFLEKLRHSRKIRGLGIDAPLG